MTTFNRGDEELDVLVERLRSLAELSRFDPDIDDTIKRHNQLVVDITRAIKARLDRIDHEIEAMRR